MNFKYIQLCILKRSLLEFGEVVRFFGSLLSNYLNNLTIVVLRSTKELIRGLVDIEINKGMSRRNK